MRFLQMTAAVAALALVAPMASAEPLNILFFGNSFTIGNDVSGDVRRLAAADGYESPRIVADLDGGKDLDYHIGEVDNNPQNNVNHPTIAGRTWDFVVMQGFSTEPTHMGDPADFRADALSLYRKVRDHTSGRGAGVTGVLYETWARQAGHAFYSGNRPNFSGPTEMQAELREGYQAALSDILAAEGAGSALLAPVGDAFEALNFASYLYSDDRYHANNTGSLLSSMVLYRTIYGEDVSDIAFSSVSSWAGVSQSTWNTLATTADAMVVPEPVTGALVALGVPVLLARRRRAV